MAAVVIDVGSGSTQCGKSTDELPTVFTASEDVCELWRMCYHGIPLAALITNPLMRTL